MPHLKPLLTLAILISAIFTHTLSLIQVQGASLVPRDHKSLSQQAKALDLAGNLSTYTDQNTSNPGVPTTTGITALQNNTPGQPTPQGTNGRPNQPTDNQAGNQAGGYEVSTDPTITPQATPQSNVGNGFTNNPAMHVAKFDIYLYL
jgi:hypothetical protein